MLILQRTQGDSIVIHKNGEIIATILVSELRPGKVKIGCKAAGSVGIDRQEIFEQRHPGKLAEYEGGAK